MVFAKVIEGERDLVVRSSDNIDVFWLNSTDVDELVIEIDIRAVKRRCGSDPLPISIWQSERTYSLLPTLVLVRSTVEVCLSDLTSQKSTLLAKVAAAKYGNLNRKACK